MKNKKSKRKLLWKTIVFFFLYMILFTGVTGFLITLYGPFDNVKRTFVASAMETMNHQYLATMFLSQSKIDKILGKDTSISSNSGIDKENTNEIKVSNSGDNLIVKSDIKTPRFDGYMLEVSNPKRIRVGYTKKLGTSGQTTSEIVKAFGGIAGINGGGFTDTATNGKQWVGTGSTPEGIVVTGGKIIFNGAKANPSQLFESIAFTNEGKLIVGKHTIGDLLSQGVQEALCFNQTLIVGGKLQPISSFGAGLAPRTVIGQKKDGHVLLIVVDGRKAPNLGATLKELQNILIQAGAWNAAALDGGSSTTMCYQGELINTPSNSTGERSIATAFYVTP